MRELNFLSTSTNRAALAITQTLYDRRALDCTSDKPLINSLQQLIFLTSSSGRVRETLCFDGGLERLVTVMKECSSASSSSPSFTFCKWHLCLQCLLNLGARGSEHVRRRIVEAGAIPVIATVLDNYLDLYGRNALPPAEPQKHFSRDATLQSQPQLGQLAQGSSMTRAELFLSQFSRATGQQVSFQEIPSSLGMGSALMRLNPNPEMNDEFISDNDAMVSDIMDQSVEQPQFVQGVLAPNEQDISWSLEILAFVTKYVHLKQNIQHTHLVPKLSVRPRETVVEDLMVCDDEPKCYSEFSDLEEAYAQYDFENTWDVDEESRTKTFNLFALVERFTAHRLPRDFHHWAGVIMRNSCRKDESRGGIRQCANFACGKWESCPREFAKCRRCKRTRYCSKDCQLSAWSLHRYWCAPAGSSHATSSTIASRLATVETQSGIDVSSTIQRPQSVGRAATTDSDGGDSMSDSTIPTPSTLPHGRPATSQTTLQ